MSDQKLETLEKEMIALLEGLTGAERELWIGLENLVERKVAEGMSRSQVYRLLAELFRQARDIRARERRGAFKVVSTTPADLE